MTKITGKPKRRENLEVEPKIKRRQVPGRTIESRENQIISLAYDEVERRIKNHTATSQEVTHFLKEGSAKSQLEKAKLENENLLLKAKAEQIQSQKKLEKLYGKAINAMIKYQGREGEEGTEFEEEEIEEDEED